MKNIKSNLTEKMTEDPADFSLVLGGPLYQLFRRAHLSGDSLELLHRRVISIALFAWLPLFLLTALKGQAWGGNCAVPFLFDWEVHIRFLVALPLLIFAELLVHQRIRLVVKQFSERDLIPKAAKMKFDAAIASALRLRNSVLAEVLLIAIVYGVGVPIVWRYFIALDVVTWYVVPAGMGTKLSVAGLWYCYLSIPIFQFLLIRWYFRLFIWGRFLWQVSRLDLNLVPTHPDRVGGLGFLSGSAHSFMPLALAHGALLSAMIANHIFHLGAKLLAFKVEIAVMVVFVQCLAFLPLFLFTAQLARTKRVGLREYGALAERYVREFDSKWLRGGAPPNEPLVGSGDIQSLADLGNSFEIVRTMRITPVSKDAILQIAVATLAPLAPLLLTMMSLEELLKKLSGILF